MGKSGHTKNLIEIISIRESYSNLTVEMELQIDLNDAQRKKAARLMTQSGGEYSKTASKRVVQQRKQSVQTDITKDGMQSENSDILSRPKSPPADMRRETNQAARNSGLAAQISRTPLA
jgi:hypothetical protein